MAVGWTTRQSNLAELNNETSKPCIVEQWDKQSFNGWIMIQTNIA